MQLTVLHEHSAGFVAVLCCNQLTELMECVAVVEFQNFGRNTGRAFDLCCIFNGDFHDETQKFERG